MNIHLCQSLQTVCEVKELLTTSGECFVSSQDSKPMVTIKQDTMSGAYRLTFGRVAIDRDIFLDVVSWLDLDRCLRKIDKVKSRLTQPGDPKQIAHLRELIRRAKTQATRDKHEATIAAMTREPSDEEIFTGHLLFSCLLPEGFEYVCDNKMSPDGKPVVIEDGIMLSGTLNKEALGNISGSLIHHIAKDYGNKVAADFVTNLQIVINCWLQHHGLTVGLQDCIPFNTGVCDGEMNKCILEAYGVMQSEKDPDLMELKISAALNKATSLGQKISKEALKPDNNMVTMIRSGSKGNWFNISQVTGLVGQQNVMGKRLEKHFGGRTLSHFRRTGWLSHSTDTVLDSIDKNDTDSVLGDALNLFKSRGFVYNSYFKGLDPAEYFFHAAGGREGLIDTACKTSETGYLQRKITKVLEDIQTSYMGTVVTATNRVIQFSYGGDNLDANKLIKTKHGMSFVDAEHLAATLNREWESGK